MDDFTKQQVQEQFAKNADKYVASPLHASGEDLSYLVACSGTDRVRSVLDIATGGGHVANALAPLSGRVTAFDLTEQILASAQKFIAGNGHANVDFVRGDAEAMPFADGTFDLAACRIAAHHFPRVADFVQETHRVLKPGGRFLLIDNVAPEDDELDAFYNELEKQRDPSHVRAWKKSEWVRMLEEAGFRVESMKTFAKTFVFADWCYRAGLAPEETGRLEAKLLHAPENIRRFFAVETDPHGGVLRFTGSSACFQAAR